MKKFQLVMPVAIVLSAFVLAGGCPKNGDGDGTQIDRMGRPAINTALNATFEVSDSVKRAAKDNYNSASPGDWSDFVEEFEKNLAILDSLDKSAMEGSGCGTQLLADNDGPGGRYTALATVLVDDQLYVNSASGICSAGTYLGVEAEAVDVLEPGAGGCGGRPLDADVIDRSYSVLAAGALSGVGDDVENDNEFLGVFPYLAAPNID